MNPPGAPVHDRRGVVHGFLFALFAHDHPRRLPCPPAIGAAAHDHFHVRPVGDRSARAEKRENGSLLGNNQARDAERRKSAAFPDLEKVGLLKYLRIGLERARHAGGDAG